MNEDSAERGIAAGGEGTTGGAEGAAPTSGAVLGRAAGERWRDGWTAGAGGVRLHHVSQGEGPPVVLLHGFPDFWYAWRRQLPALAAAGFRAVAPDLRGYNLSGRPPRVEDYRIDLLADDVAALVRALGGRAHVVGHDWGGAIAWHLAVRYPEVIDRLVVLNAPHPARFKQVLASRPAQVLASTYIGLFQLPALPEAALGAFDRALLKRTLRRMHLRPGALTAADLAAYAAAFAEPGALRAALAYYRAVVRHSPVVPEERRRLPHRTLLLWGERDPALLAANAEGLERWVPDLRVVRVPDAGHWVMADAPDLVNRELVAHLRA